MFWFVVHSTYLEALHPQPCINFSYIQYTVVRACSDSFSSCKNTLVSIQNTFSIITFLTADNYYYIKYTIMVIIFLCISSKVKRLSNFTLLGEGFGLNIFVTKSFQTSNQTVLIWFLFVSECSRFLLQQKYFMMLFD